MAKITGALVCRPDCNVEMVHEGWLGLFEATCFSRGVLELGN